MDAVLSALFIYPVKSCRAVPMDRSPVQRRGLRHDRRWMIVDGDGKFLTQRTEPRLAQVEIAIAEDALTLSTPTMAALCVPLSPRAAGPRRRVRVWRDEVDVIDGGATAGGWISEWLGFPAALAFMPDDCVRAVNPAYGRSDDIVSFADTCPLLLASVSSLDDVNRRIDKPVPMNRFRPNLVVSGSPAWAEDEWKEIRVGDVRIRVVKPCSRCVITTTDQRTGERGAEPLRALSTFRARDNEVWFAQNCIPDDSGTVAVGDAIHLLSAGRQAS